jgi:hypothetical protein
MHKQVEFKGRFDVNDDLLIGCEEFLPPRFAVRLIFGESEGLLKPLASELGYGLRKELMRRMIVWFICLS